MLLEQGRGVPRNAGWRGVDIAGRLRRKVGEDEEHLFRASRQGLQLIGAQTGQGRARLREQAGDVF